MKRTLICALLLACAPAIAKEHHYLYAASPGIRNYLEYGGMGIVVFDIEDGYKFVRRIPTWDAPAAGQEAENVKGIAASAQDGRRLREHDQAHRRVRRGEREEALGQDVRRRLRPDRALAGRQGPLRAVVRRAALDGDQCDERRRDHEDRAELGRAQHDLRARRIARVYGGPEVAPAEHRGSEDEHGRRDGRAVRESRSGRSRSTGATRWCSSTSTACSDSRSATSRRARSCTASRCRASSRGRSSGTAARATGSR